MQTLHQPQEIEVWYVIPAIRCSLAKSLRNINMGQKEISEVLGVTKAAVSQYINLKRAKNLSFPQEIQKKINESAKKLFEKKSTTTEEIQRLLQNIRNTKLLCKFHKQHCLIEKECTVCIE